MSLLLPPAAAAIPLSDMNLKRLLTNIGVYPEEGFRSVGRVVILAALVGVVSGLGAIIFHLMCLFITHYALTVVAGYEQGGPANEKEWNDLFAPQAADVVHTLIPWLLVIVPTVGGLISGFLVYKFAPEAEGHGTDAAIDAYHNKRGLIKARVPLIKTIASAITLGTGGSGGREGPIAQIGAGFGSYLATRLRLSNEQRRALLAAGLGAGIGAIFHAPLAGAIFACEVMYRDLDFEAENLIPAFIATTVAYTVFSIPFGAEAFDPLFDVNPNLEFVRPLPLLLPLAVLAVFSALLSLLYTKSFYGIHHLFKRLPLPNIYKPAIGAFLTGVVALLLYFSFTAYGEDAQHGALSVLSFGYGFLQNVLSGEASIPVLLIAAVGLGKILTTSLTIGSGGSGGVFGPSMVIGGCGGAIVGMTFHHLMPGIVHSNDVVIFTLLGMASFFAAAANTPVSTLIMVTEMTSSYVLLFPSMWVCALAYLISRGWSLYIKQVRNHRESPAHRGDFIVDVLQGLTVKDAMHRALENFVTVTLDAPLAEMQQLLTNTRQTTFPVVDPEGHYYGAFGLNDIRQFIYEQGDLAQLAVAQDLASTHKPLTLQMPLSEAISVFTDDALAELPVVDANEPQKIIGLLTRQELIATYSARLLAMRSEDALPV